MAIEASIQRAMPVHLFTHILFYSHQDVEPHEIRTHPEHPSSPSLSFSTIHIIQSFVFCMVFCKSLSSCPYFFWSLYCMSFFDLRILNTPLQGRIQGRGAHPAHPPPKIGQNMIFFWRKIVIFHTKYPKNFRTSFRNWKKFDFLA